VHTHARANASLPHNTYDVTRVRMRHRTPPRLVTFLRSATGNPRGRQTAKSDLSSNFSTIFATSFSARFSRPFA